MSRDNAWLQQVIEQSSEGIAIADAEGTLIVWNSAMETMTGIPSDEVLGKPLWEVQARFLPPERRTPEILRFLEKEDRVILRDGLSGAFNDPFQRADGTIRYQTGSYTAIKTADGHLFCSVARDTTEQREAERRLESYARQQGALSAIARIAVSETRSQALYEEVVTQVATALDAHLCGAFELVEDGTKLVLVAGAGWPDGSVGCEELDARGDSLPAVALRSNEQVVRSGSARVAGVDVTGGTATAVGASGKRQAVIAAYCTERSRADEDATDFMGSVGYMLSEASHRLRSDERLRESEGLYRRMYQSASVGTTRVSLDYLFQDANPAYCRMLGYEQNEIVGMSIFDVLDPDTVAASRELQDSLRDGRIPWFQSEKKYVHKDGHTVWGLLDTSLVRDEAGSPLYFLGNVINITERKRAESEVRRLSVGVEQSPVAIVITDPEGTIEYVNARFSSVTGYDKTEVIGENPRVLKSGEQDSQFYANLWKTILSGQTWSGEFHNRRKDGSLFWEEATIGSISDESGTITHFIAFKEDVTEKKELENQLLQSQRLDAIGQLAGGIAHDFNNLLTVISGYGALVRDSLPGEDPRLADVQQILAAGERAAALTQQLLAFSRKQVIRPALINLNTVVGEMTGMLERLVGENIDLSTILDPRMGKTRVDPVQVNQIVMNLVVNSRDALRGGGHIVLETGRTEFDARYSERHIGANPGSYCMISVSDNGIGMDQKTLAHAFEPFFTTKPVGEGTGLGLSTVYGIVKQHNGYVWLYSEPGHGTSVKVYLPRADSEDPADDTDTSAPVVVRGNETILLAEDDDTVRGLTAGVLEGAGYTVLHAPNGALAHRLYQERREDIDLLVSDVIMPSMGGKELADLIRTDEPELPVLFVSGYTDEAISRTGILRDSVNLLSKPFHPSDLLERVRAALDATRR